MKYLPIHTRQGQILKNKNQYNQCITEIITMAQIVQFKLVIKFNLSITTALNYHKEIHNEFH